MNLQQFRVLDAAIRLMDPFTTDDLCRESGASKDVVRKTYQRYAAHFETVGQVNLDSGGRSALRRLTEYGRVLLLTEIDASRKHLQAPPAPQGPEGEPLSLLAAERILYELIPIVDRAARGDLIEEAAGLIELATVSLPSLEPVGDSLSPAQNTAIRSRLSSVRSMCEQVELVHQSVEKVTHIGVAQRIAGLADRVLSADVARTFTMEAGVKEDIASLLFNALPNTASSFASALRLLGMDEAWVAVLGVSRCWSEEEVVALKAVEDREDDVHLASCPFTIHVKWKPENLTSVDEVIAPLLIAFGDRRATRYIDQRSGRVLDWADLDMGAMAERILSNWWRMRWEAKPWGQVGSSWLKAHSMRHFLSNVAAPNIRIWSDGEMIRASAKPFTHHSLGRSYISEFETTVPPPTYEQVVDKFISEAVGHLSPDGKGRRISDLARRLAEERQDPAILRYRCFEAMLGFDRDSAPNQVIQELRDLAVVTGENSSAELAHAFAGQLAVAPDSLNENARRGSEIREMLADIRNLSESALALQGKSVGLEIRPISSSSESTGTAPWTRGLNLARRVREELGLQKGPVDDKTLASTLGLTVNQMRSEAPYGAADLLLGMAVRDQDAFTSRFIFRTGEPDSRRFEAARMLADSLLVASNEPWLLTTDAKTARQKAQRAFAIEFLCPIAELKSFFRRSYSVKEAYRASRYYRVSPVGIENHVANNARELLGEVA